MTPLPKGPTKATAASIPFTPTFDASGTPTTCYCCGRRAWGIGAGDIKTEPKWLCKEDFVLIKELRDIKRLDVYELQALDGGVDAVGEYLQTIGITDLAAMDELNARMLVKAAWQGSAARLRQLLLENEAPF